MKRTALLIFTIAMVTCNTADTYPTRVVQFTDIADDLAPSNQHGARFEGADLFVTRRTVPACFSALPNYNHNADLVIGTYQMMSNLYSGQHPAPVVLNGSISFSAVHVNGSKYTPETLSVPAGSAVERPAGAFGNMFNHNCEPVEALWIYTNADAQVTHVHRTLPMMDAFVLNATFSDLADTQFDVVQEGKTFFTVNVDCLKRCKLPPPIAVKA